MRKCHFLRFLIYLLSLFYLLFFVNHYMDSDLFISISNNIYLDGFIAHDNRSDFLLFYYMVLTILGPLSLGYGAICICTSKEPSSIYLFDQEVMRSMPFPLWLLNYRLNKEVSAISVKAFSQSFPRGLGVGLLTFYLEKRGGEILFAFIVLPLLLFLDFGFFADDRGFLVFLSAVTPFIQMLLILEFLINFLLIKVSS